MILSIRPLNLQDSLNLKRIQSLAISIAVNKCKGDSQGILLMQYISTKMTKKELKDYAIPRLYDEIPDKANDVPTKIINDTLVYIEGYEKACIDNLITEEYLKERAYDYIVKRLTSN